MRVLLLFAAVALMGIASGVRSDEAADGRLLYAMAEAGSEYCPGVAMRTLIRPAIADSFGMDAQDEIRSGRLDAEKARIIAAFRAAGSRAAVCEEVMRLYGPGGSPHLFEWR